MKTPSALAATALTLTLLALPSSALAAEKGAADLLPPTTVLYAEITDPKALVGAVLEHPLRGRLEAVPAYQAALTSPGYLVFKGVLAFVELRIGKGWRPTLESLTAGGVHLAVDAETGGLALLLKSDDPEFLKQTRDTFIEMVREDHEKKGKGEIEEKFYRGIKATKINDLVLATLDDWLLLSNKGDLAKFIADRHLDGGEDTFARDGTFAAVRDGWSEGAARSLRAYVDLEALRAAGAAKNLFRGPQDNPLAELLFGGVAAALPGADFATGSANLGAGGLSIQLSLPTEVARDPGARRYFFRPSDATAAPAPLRPREQIFSLRAYRDLAAFWLGAEDLFDENTTANIAKSESDLSNLFAGRDIGSDILATLQPDLQLVVSRQKRAAADYPEPAIKLPAFALIFDLREPEKMRRQLKLSFQSMIGFLNIVGAQQGQPPLELNNEKLDGAEIASASYIPELAGGGAEEMKKQGKMIFNFSPSVAFSGRRLIISSTSALARELVDLDRATPSPAAANPADNARARFSFDSLRDILADNRRHLVSQNMLEKGHNKQQAETEIDLVLTALSWFQDATLDLSATGDAIDLDLALRLRSESEGESESEGAK